MAETHEDYRREHATKVSSERSFGLVMTAGFALVAFAPLVRNHPARWWAAPVAGIFLLLSVAVPRALRPLNRAWFKLGLLLGRIVSPVMLFVLYFLLFAPMGLLMRAFGKNLLGLRKDPRAGSYWVLREQPAPSGPSLKNQF